MRQSLDESLTFHRRSYSTRSSNHLGAATKSDHNILKQPWGIGCWRPEQVLASLADQRTLDVPHPPGTWIADHR